MQNAPYPTAMRLAFIAALDKRPAVGATALDRLVLNKLRAGVGIRWPRRPKR